MEQELQKLGLEEKEIQIYLAALAQGAPTPTLIAKATGLKRATVYFYLDRLIDKGLMEWEVHKARKHIALVPPRRGLKNFVTKKKEEVMRNEDIVKQLLVEIEKLPQAKGAESRVYHYEGEEGIRFAIEKALATRKDMYWFGSIETMVSAVGEDKWYRLFTRHRLKQGTATYGLTDRRVLKYPRFSEMQKSKRYFRFFEEDFDLPTVLALFGDSLCLFSKQKNEMRVVLVENALMAQTLKFLFKALWNSLSKE